MKYLIPAGEDIMDFWTTKPGQIVPMPITKPKILKESKIQVNVERAILTLHFIDGSRLNVNIKGVASDAYKYDRDYTIIPFLVHILVHSITMFRSDINRLLGFILDNGDNNNYINPLHVVRTEITNIEPHWVEVTKLEWIDG